MISNATADSAIGDQEIEKGQSMSLHRHTLTSSFSRDVHCPALPASLLSSKPLPNPLIC